MTKRTKTIVVTLGAVLPLLVILTAVLIFNSFTIVNEGHVGIKYRFGVITADDLNPGLNFKTPFIEEIRQVDIRNQLYVFDSDAYTADTQVVNFIIKVTYFYDRTQLTALINNIGIENTEAALIVPNLSHITKTHIGSISAEDLIKNRGTVNVAIRDELFEILIPHGIIITSLAIENLEFCPLFEEALRAKIIAEQDELEKQNRQMREEAEECYACGQPLT